MKMTHKLGLLAMVAQTLVQSALGGQLQSLASETPSELTPAQPAIQDSVVRITADASGLQLVPFLDLPKNGTYWEVLPGGITAPLPVPLFDPSLPVFSISGDIFLVDATEGQIVINPHQSVGLSPTDARAAAVNSEATKVANLISQVQAAVAPTETVAPKAKASSLLVSASSIPLPGSGGTVSGNAMTNPVTYNNVDYGTNLWFAPTGVASGSVAGFASNTIADVYYEIQSRTNLMQTDWQSEGFIPGSELTNWTVLSVAQGNRPNLFLRLKSWIDSFDIGIPDWWQIEYFGTNGIDPNASVTGDGYSNLQKFDMGLNPTNYYNPNGPPGFFGYLDTSGTNAYIAWSPSPGPVTGYSIQRGVSNSISGVYTFFQAGLVNSNASFFKDAGAITSANTSNNVYKLEAVYASGLSATDTWLVSWGRLSSLGAPYGPPFSTNVHASVDATGTNVLLSWNPASTVATNYLIERGVYNLASNAYIYTKIALVSPNTSSLSFSGAISNAANWGDLYGVAAVYPGNVPSSLTTAPIIVGAVNGLAAPGTFYGYLTASGTNLMLYWSAAPGSPVKYVIFGATNVTASGANEYFTVGTVQGTVSTFTVTNAFDADGNNLYVAFSVFAIYADGSLSQAASWQTANAPPAPGGFVAYFDASGTNVVLSWAAPNGTITGYVIQRSDIADNFEYYVGSNATSFVDTNAVNTGSFDPNYTQYTIQASYPQGGLSAAATAMVGVLPAPSGLNAVVDGTGTNVQLSWSPVQGAASSYLIQRGVYNPSTGAYTYTTIGTVGPKATTFTDNGAITGANSYNNRYTLEAVYAGGQASAFVSSGTLDTSALPMANVIISVSLIRNQSGHWQLMLGSIPTNVQAILVDWCQYYYDGWDAMYYDEGPQSLFQELQSEGAISLELEIPTTAITNGIYVVPDWQATSTIPNDLIGVVCFVRALGGNNVIGRPALAGFLTADSPCFTDGRRHLKQNLSHELRASTMTKPISDNGLNYLLWQAAYGGDTNSAESSFLHKSYHDSVNFVAKDDLWPFTVNYIYHQSLYDTNYSGPPTFEWDKSLTTIPAPAVLDIGEPYWIQLITDTGMPYGFSDPYYIPLFPYVVLGGWPPTQYLADVGSYTNNGLLCMQSGVKNVYGLAFTNAMVAFGQLLQQTQYDYTPVELAPGNCVDIAKVGCFYRQVVAPNLGLAGYYFAAVNTPGTMLPYGLTFGVSPTQTAPLPCLTGFANTNQTGLMIASVGTPTTIGGWAKYSIQNGSQNKFAYLGQYFTTNAFVISNGVVMTNTTGVVSPYGDFFPTQAGAVAMATMPDIDTGLQGTGVVRVISMNVDANHDAVMDLNYQGPDFVSASKPFRFWANDNQDAGDFGGNFGVPGYQPSYRADGYDHQQQDGIDFTWIYRVHGTRDLLDFFPVYLNIGSLFQSNALSAGISATDTNYQYVLSQADGVLRFAYTSLTPTNYMNFLLDTNTAQQLGGFYYRIGNYFDSARLTTIGNGGVSLRQSFVGGIAASNQGIILVEAATNTTQPLVLTIYHGTNQIAQTSLPLSITGVEQMFRSKTMMLHPAAGTVSDRLTDADVPNEPDTEAKNFVFMHGYNVLPDEARGVAADMFKRMYWSGSHAKFWAVTWEGADTKGTLPFRNLLTPNYHTNVVNAFATAPILASFIASLTNSGPVVAAAHSLGNVLTLSAISDWNAPISQYFMMDAAVPIEAIDPTDTTNMMIFSTWTAYSNRVFASDWHQLFPTNDARSTLTWSNRLGNLGNVDVYNFYSSGEEVLRTFPGDPPPTVLNKVFTQLSSFWPSGVPFGTYTWYWQEKGKGTCTQNWFLGSSHGGWLFPLNSWGDPTPLPPATANALSNSVLQVTPVFTFGSYYDQLTGPFPDWALLGSGGSSYAAVYRNRILSDAIPAMSLVAGANPIPSFDNNHNRDMMTLENGWSPGRIGDEASKWHHSDFVQMAYTFSHQLFDKFVTIGNLK